MTPSLTLACTPHGRLVLVPAEHADAGLPADGEAAAPFASHDDGTGVLHLALLNSTARTAAHFGDAPLAFAQAVGRAYLSQRCSLGEGQDPAAGLAFPADDLERLLAAVPPMRGGEYVDSDCLRALWDRVDAAFSASTKAFGSVAAFLDARGPSWRVVGRVTFHLAENKREPERPFAFLATYTDAVGAHGKAQHVPLGRALQTLAGTRNKAKLLALLRPVEAARATSAWVAALVESGELYHPLAWSPAQAHAFLHEVPALEAAGIVVRVPDWWKGKRPARPQVKVTVGARSPSTLGLGAMLDFDVSVTLGDEPLTAAELRALQTEVSGLVRLRGQWVELDRERLDALLAHWKQAKRSAREGLSFLEGMRLLAGVGASGAGAVDPSQAPDMTGAPARIEAGAWLREALEHLRTPAESTRVPASLRAELRPYQRAGLAWLRHVCALGLGGCLADDMGLGKTVQLIALLCALRETGPAPALLVVPTSLLGNWTAELERFAPHLRVHVEHPSAGQAADDDAKAAPEAVATAGRRAPPKARALGQYDVVLTTYGLVHRQAALREVRWRIVALDEAQAIKNGSTRQARAVKTLSAGARLALTGTPIENHTGDLHSLFDFLNPGLCGSAAAFTRATRAMEKSEGGFAPLRRLVGPYILRRLKTDKSIISDLPDKTELVAYCKLSRAQAKLYEESVRSLASELRRSEEAAKEGGLQRRGLVLAYLTRLKQICNHPSQWLGDGAWDAESSGKLLRLRELCEPIAERQEKVLVFTQFRELCEPLAAHLRTSFGRDGLVLHGETAASKRRALVERFAQEDGPPFFVLSLKAGGTGLNLTAASHVIHFDRWWNPAVENQATDRAYRIGQRRNVLVHKFVCRGTIEERVDTLLQEKQRLASELLADQAGEVKLTELSTPELLRLVNLDLASALGAD